VRLPTEAEWEYAYGAGVTDPSDLYVDILAAPGGRDMPPRFADIMIWWETDVEPKLKDAGLDAQIPNLPLKLKGAEVGTKRPNAWGLYDMLGNQGECLLDRFDLGKLKRLNGSPARGTGVYDWRSQDAFIFQLEETDPLNWATDGDVVQMVRGSGRFVKWRGHLFRKSPSAGMGLIPFRLCIGPDLIQEKGLKK
jgi:formylglycine-generating enzyme required for sulfatase activity